MNTDNQATGVEVDYFGQTFVYNGGKEIILSAGSIESPHLLMLSGIGPKQMLDEAGVDLKLDIPGVGRNLQDHPVTLIPVKTDEPSSSNNPLFLWSLWDWFQLFTLGNGALTDNGLGVNGLFHTKVNNDSLRPDMQLLFTSQSMGNTYGLGLQRAFGIGPKGAEFMVKPSEDFQGGVLALVLLREKSVGRLRLTSSNIKDPLLIEENLLDHPDDAKTFISAIRHVMQLEATKSFTKYNMKILGRDQVHCDAMEYDSDEYWDCYVRHWTFTLYHQVGTCRMGPRSDLQSVVDPTLKVYGTQGLRVIDGSVMPKIVGANTNAAITMIGERGAGFILDDWGRMKTDAEEEAALNGKTEL